eukprot:gene26619-32168_t
MASNVQLSRSYLQVAMLYQQQDLALHTGGDLQRKALRYFNLAINASSEFSVPLTLKNGMLINPLIIIVPAYYQRGMLLKMMGNAQGAIESYTFLLGLFSQYPSLHTVYEKSLVFSSLADAYLSLGDLAQTVKYFHSALSIAPCKTEYWYGLVNALKEYLYKYKQATCNESPANLCTEQYVLVDSDSVKNVLEVTHGHCQCNMTVSPYLSLDHASFMHYSHLVYGPSRVPLTSLDSRIDIYTEEEVLAFAYTSDIQEYTSHAHLSAMSYVYDDLNQYRYATKESDVYYGLSYVFDALGQNAQAYTYIQYANRVEEELRRLRYGMKYDPVEQEVSFNNTANIFSEQFFSGVQIDPSSAEGVSSLQVELSQDVTSDSKVKVAIQPIFIVGMMRSGSTLLESMLDSHSLCIGIGEESLFNANLKDFRDKLIAASRGSGASSIDANDASVDVLSERKRVQHEMKQEIYAYRRKLTKLAYERVKGQVCDIWRQRGSPREGLKVYIVDKMLFNYRNLGFIQLVFPESPILHIYRDPLDTLYSIYKHKFDEMSLFWSLKWSYILNEYKLYIKYISHFNEVLHEDRISHIRYEDLVKKPDSYLLEVLEMKLGLSFEENVLEFHSMPRSVQTHSQSQVRQKLYQSSIGSWRKYASQLEPVIKLLRKDLAKLKKEKHLEFVKGLKMNWKVEYNHPDYGAAKPSSS